MPDPDTARAPGKAESAAAALARGNALQAQGRLDEALASFDAAIALAPALTGAYFNRGNLLDRLKRYDEAIASYEQAIARDPAFAAAYNHLGNTLRKRGRYQEALACHEKVIALRGDYPQAYTNRGNALQELGRFDQALASFDKAIALEPGYARAFYNRGNLLSLWGRHDEAIASYDRAVAAKPDYAAAHWNKSLLLLLRGDFEAGWPLYEWRWACDEFPSAKRDFAQPLWLGAEALSGKTILLHAEQGLGDTIQFCRYAPLVTAHGAKVMIEVQRPLKSLVESLEGASHVVPRGNALPRFDCQTPLLSLPLALGTRLDSIPAQVPYLKASAASMCYWAETLGERRRLRVGLAWSGSPTHKHDRNRSIALAELLPLLACDADLIGLQKEVRPEDSAVLASAPPLNNPGPSLADFADTAALIANLDLVISVDTAVAHLAGALGKPVWIMLPFEPDWRWLLGRDDSPWYPTARLFRQAAPGDWGGVVARIAAALKAFQG
ncbi:MAG: tetratricopeptide repeat protein [Alphaproteobacteria bacterium]